MALNGKPAHTKKYVLPDGREVSLADLPLVTYTMACGHTGTTFGVTVGDLLFCETCLTHTKVVSA